MKIAITGGSGFIGTRLHEALKKAGHDTVNIDLKDSNPCDILDLPELTKRIAGCEAIYHLAAEHRDDVFPRSRYYDVNVTGTGNVTKAADTNGISRIIFTSSFAVYGLDTGTPDEMSKPAPFNDYGQSKPEGEEVLRKWEKANETAQLTIVRPVVIFGENNRGNVYTLVKQIASGKFLMIGNGDNKKSMAYVGNITAFLQHCLSADHAGQIYNYADAPDYTTNALIDVICGKLGAPRPKMAVPYIIGLGAGYAFDAAARVSGKTFPISAVRVQKFCADTSCNAGKAHRSGFKAPYTLEEGFARFINHDFTNQRKAA